VSPGGARGYHARMVDGADPTVRATLRRAVDRLAGGSDAPHADAEELLSRLLGVERGALRTSGARALTPEELARFEGWLARRLAGEPVQYVTGRAAFRSLDLAVDRRVLVPRPETEGLVDAVLEALARRRAAWPRPAVLDLGTGSGAIALAIASEWPWAFVTATDASAGALEVARANAASLGLAGRVTFAQGDWFAAVGADERFEVVVANPPYVSHAEAAALPADVREWEPHAALFGGEDGLHDLRAIVEDAPRHLVAGGLLALELDETRAHEVAGWLQGAHDWSDVRLLDDLAGRPRVLLAHRERGPAIAPAQWGEER
jgi:release factor glutamine methyltransferase